MAIAIDISLTGHCYDKALVSKAGGKRMTVAIAKWTLEEYHQMIELGLLDDKRVELIRGEIVEMPPEGESHAYFSTESGNYLVRRLGERALVRQAKPITLPNASEPEPDVSIVRPLGREYLSHHPYPENIFWLIEYSNSSLAKDLNLKAQVYAEVEIAEYWVVDLKARSLIVFREPQAGQYTARTAYTEGQLTPLAFPDISISVSAIISQA
ncbi:MAG: Uma2 family endonuclease [Phormidesmis sp.]